jgi:hypothetical protein
MNQYSVSCTHGLERAPKRSFRESGGSDSNERKKKVVRDEHHVPTKVGTLFAKIGFSGGRGGGVVVSPPSCAPRRPRIFHFLAEDSIVRHRTVKGSVDLRRECELRGAGREETVKL